MSFPEEETLPATPTILCLLAFVVYAIGASFIIELEGENRDIEAEHGRRRAAEMSAPPSAPAPPADTR